MEGPHHSHKDDSWGWMETLRDWRRSRTRRRLRAPARKVRVG